MLSALLPKVVIYMGVQRGDYPKIGMDCKAKLPAKCTVKKLTQNGFSVRLRCFGLNGFKPNES